MKKVICFFVCVLICIGFSVKAQVTTSVLSGKIIDDQNEYVIGATVVAVHEPSGTMYGAVTNVDGRYTIQGMRTGGPYKVEISYVGYKKAIFTDIRLELGNTYLLNATLYPSSEQLGEVVVTADAKANIGASENFSTGRIQETPTVDRNIYDVVKNMPMAMTSKNGGITFAGSNNRYNSFQIDGTVSNDVFGLAPSGTNGGQTNANPISMDAIQEIQVVVAPFDVRQSGFTGGGINAITKQGNNTYHASVYSYFTNEGLYGKYNAYKDNIKDKLTEQSTKTFGGTLSGPIIKDKLFFFANAENRKESYPSRFYAGYDEKGFSTDMAQKIADKYEEYTGIRESFGSRDVDQRAFNFLGRIDWNIDRNNKLAFRYQYNNSYDDIFSPSSTTYFFNGSGYRMKNKTNSFVAEWNSHWSDVLYNEFRAGVTTVRDERQVAYQGPNVKINGSDNSGTNNTTVNIGTEYSSGANALDQDIYTFEDNLSWYKGNHTFTFGTHNEIFRMKNLFIQAVTGSWEFGSMDAFLNDSPSKYVFKYTDPDVTGGNYRYTPIIKAGQFGFYAQDKWDVADNFSLTYGLRFDIPLLFNDPTVNNEFNEYAASKNIKERVGEMPGAKVMVSPRLGFRWYTDDSRTTLIRGGLGLFTGRVPFVWLSNAYNNTGVEQKGTTIFASGSTSAPSLGQYADDPIGAMNSQKGNPATPDIVTVSKDFKYPQVFRVNLALERVLPGDVKMTLEGLYSKTFNNVYFENLALSSNAKVYAVPGVETSATPYYSVDKKYFSITNLKNTNMGYTYSLSALFEKSFHFGLDLAASYTFGHSKSVYDGTSSVAYSNWKYNYAVDSNNPGLAYSMFDIPHRVMVSVGYRTPRYAKGFMATTVSLVYNGYVGQRYSLTMNESYYDAEKKKTVYIDYNGDGWGGNSLLYIPTEDELQKMDFKTEEDRRKFDEWIEGDSYAKKHRGAYAMRNSNSAPWENRVDLHVAQDIFVLKDRGSKFQVTFDVTNFANMLNKKWGTTYTAAYNVMPLQVIGSKKGEDGNYTNTYAYNSRNTITKNDVLSRWHAQIGIKYIF